MKFCFEKLSECGDGAAIRICSSATEEEKGGKGARGAGYSYEGVSNKLTRSGGDEGRKESDGHTERKEGKEGKPSNQVAMHPKLAGGGMVEYARRVMGACGRCSVDELASEMEMVGLDPGV